MIFQLPYMKNFENGPQNKMWDYNARRCAARCTAKR